MHFIHVYLNFFLFLLKKTKTKAISLNPHLLLIFAQLSPHLSCLLRDLCDGDAGVVRLDSLTAGVEPKHIRTHWSLGSPSILLLLLLTLKIKRNWVKKCLKLHTFMYSVYCDVWWLILALLLPLFVAFSLFSPSPLWLFWPFSSLHSHLRSPLLLHCCRLLRHCCHTWLKTRRRQ